MEREDQQQVGDAFGPGQTRVPSETDRPTGAANVPIAEMEAAQKAWMADCGYLPQFMRDFHAQKDLFKALHDRVAVDKHNYCKEVSWVGGHCYVVDIFLWWMAKHGWTLQRSRKDIPFFDIDATIESTREIRNEHFARNLGLAPHRVSDPEGAKRSAEGDRGEQPSP